MTTGDITPGLVRHFSHINLPIATLIARSVAIANSEQGYPLVSRTEFAASQASNDPPLVRHHRLMVKKGTQQQNRVLNRCQHSIIPSNRTIRRTPAMGCAATTLDAMTETALSDNGLEAWLSAI